MWNLSYCKEEQGTMSKIKVFYFSPTGGTLQVAKHLAESMSKKLCVEVEYHSYTLPNEREVMPVFDAGDVVVWATPVYAGRIPNKTLDYVRNALHGNGNLSVALVTFGNRAYDNALAELVGLMEDGGMKSIGAAAMVTRHVFSDTLGASRPNEDDVSALEDFATKVSEKILSSSNDKISALKVPGETHPDKYYTPLKTTNVPASFLKAKPSCDVERCSRCGKCLDVCPMGSIEVEDGVPVFNGVCIKCQACRLKCPNEAISFTDPDYHSHIAMIERNFSSPKQPEFFVVDE